MDILKKLKGILHANKPLRQSNRFFKIVRIITLVHKVMC